MNQQTNVIDLQHQTTTTPDLSSTRSYVKALAVCSKQPSKNRSPPTLKPTKTYAMSTAIAWSCATATCRSERSLPEPDR